MSLYNVMFILNFVESIQLYSTLHVFAGAKEGLELLHFLCVAEVEQKSTKWKRLYLTILSTK